MRQPASQPFRPRVIGHNDHNVVVAVRTHHESPKLKSGMSDLRQVEELLPGLSRGEKALLLRLVVQDLDDAFPGIDSTPGVCGGEPCIVRSRIPVWALEQSRRLGISEDALLHSYPALRAEDLVNAWAYVRSHRTEIEDQIRENEDI